MTDNFRLDNFFFFLRLTHIRRYHMEWNPPTHMNPSRSIAEKVTVVPRAVDLVDPVVSVHAKVRRGCKRRI